MKISRSAYRSAVRVALATASILLVPLAAMQITDEVDWGLADFVLAGALLGGTGLLLELAARKLSSTHLQPGRAFSESRNRRDWAVLSSG